MDRHRLDHRAGLGDILGFATANRNPGTTFATHRCLEFLLYGLWAALPDGSTVLQFLRRRPAKRSSLMLRKTTKMRTNIEIDDELMRKAMRSSPNLTKRELV